MEDRSLDEFLNAAESDGDEQSAPGDDEQSAPGDDGADADPGVTGNPEDADGSPEDADGSPEDLDEADADPAGTRETETGAGRVAVDPATATSVWDPGGGACAACGAGVRRRWRGEAGLVCGECKEW